jgi:hypothetical protein
MTDTFTLAAVADVLAVVTSRYATANTGADDDDVVGWPDMSAELHPSDAGDAARDLIDHLAARGSVVRRIAA